MTSDSAKEFLKNAGHLDTTSQAKGSDNMEDFNKGCNFSFFWALKYQNTQLRGHKPVCNEWRKSHPENLATRVPTKRFSSNLIKITYTVIKEVPPFSFKRLIRLTKLSKSTFKFELLIFAAYFHPAVQ